MKSENIQIKDYLQDTFDLSQYSIVRDIILIVSVYLFYRNIPFEIFINLIKYYICLIIIRWILSNITTITKKQNDKDKKYFQISGHTILFVLLILMSLDNNIFTNKTLAYIIIVAYSLLNILVKAHYSYDVLMSIFLTFYMYNYLKNYM